MSRIKAWIVDRVGIVRVRQIVENLTHRLAFIPIALIIVALLASQASLALDRALGDVDVPLPLATTVDSARAIFAAIAGGLITAVTLLLSMMLVAVQLASGQFSPRTLRNWLGDRTLRRAVGIVLGTTVFCLMGLRSVRDDLGITVIPTITVLIGVFCGVASLVVMIQAVDHVTRSLQVGNVAQRLVDETIETIRADESATLAHERPAATPAQRIAADVEPDDDAIVVESTGCGWVQQVDEQSVLDALPEGASAWIRVAHGAYVTTHSPLAYVSRTQGIEKQGAGDDSGEEELIAAVRRAFALGSNRTMQRDVGFGLQQLTDIAVRALSPGVNDPQTARDVVVHLGEVLREIWSHPRPDDVLQRDGVSVHRAVSEHAEHLRAALDPIRRYGRSDPSVVATLASTLRHLRTEVVRRDLPGPTEPIDEFLEDLVADADDANWLPRERCSVEAGRPPRSPSTSS